ncbi:MAG: GatB/YqeY domain-containing protein, partial [Rhodobacterales bacterium]
MRDRINSAMKQAMRDKEVLRLSTLRLVMAAIKDRDIAARVDGVDNSVSDDEILAILGKMIKQRKDSATAYGNAGRTELAAQELSEIEIITGFLPKQLNDDEIGDVVKKVINDSGASGIRDMGKVMGL